MKRRSKLDLSAAARGPGKHQAAGFEQVIDPGPATNGPGYSADGSAGEPGQRSRRLEAMLPDPATRKLIVKTVAVVAVVALTLFLLKRR